MLPYEEFVAVQELIEDMEDLRLLEEAKANDPGGPGVSIEEVNQKFGLK